MSVLETVRTILHITLLVMTVIAYVLWIRVLVQNIRTFLRCRRKKKSSKEGSDDLSKM